VLKTPNLRRLILPDPGYVLVDCDLSGADAQVVAWEADDQELKAAFRAGLKVHRKNFEDMWGRPFTAQDEKIPLKGRRYTPYDEMKRAVHATNYGAADRTVAITLGWTVSEANSFQGRWFNLHPGIREWHKRTERELQLTRTIYNKFGYRIVFFDRVDGLLPEALAWTPQSTVGLVCSRAAVNLSRIWWVQVLLQVHDSVAFQLPIKKFTPSNMALIRDALTVLVPYPDPLTIPWGIKASVKSWGDLIKTDWDLTNRDEIIDVSQYPLPSPELRGLQVSGGAVPGVQGDLASVDRRLLPQIT